MGGNPYETGPTWPTIDHNDKELRIKRDNVKKIIDDLKKNDLNKYTTQHGKAGLPDELSQTVGKITQQDVGAVGGGTKTSYPAGQKVWEMIKRVNDAQNGFPALYQNFVRSYNDVIDALYANAGLLDDAEQNSQVQGTGSQNTGSNQSFNSGQQQT